MTLELRLRVAVANSLQQKLLYLSVQISRRLSLTSRTHGRQQES